jgi:hypothetical protein
MLAFYVDLLVRAFFAIPPSLGGNMLGLVWPVIIVFCGEIIACIVYGYRTVIAKWKEASLIGLAALVVCYTGLFVWCIFSTNYRDHSVLASRAAFLRQAYDSNSEHEKYAVLVAESKCAEVLGENRTLGQQNRDQQNTINNCQNKAIALLAPPALRFSGGRIYELPVRLGVLDGVFVLVTSKVVTPVRIDISCDRTVLGAVVDQVVGGGGTIVDNFGSDPKGQSVQVGFDSPAWLPQTPLLVHVNHTGDGGMSCEFTPG